ncbi:MAG TPA: helix-turn-helix transcriptional regulator [Thermoanaerobaculia bacterium]|nr:helix-turn-helix transcriptional regulator [Thermoanaerobaculia bacterium]
MVDAELSEREGLLVELGSRIAQLRLARGWSQAQLALRLGLPRNRVTRWESGIHGPQLHEVVALGRLLRVSADELLTGERVGVGPLRESGCEGQEGESPDAMAAPGFLEEVPQWNERTESRPARQRVPSNA